MKRISITCSALAVAALVAGSAFAGTNNAVVIRHELHGCHAWSVDGNAFKAAQSLSVKAGATVTFTNNDVMAQPLVELSGGRVVYAGNRALNKPAAVVRVTFAKPGRYVFGTKPGEDYMKGIKTIGADNVLKLVVTVR